ncbi:DNA primase [Candidatus Thiodictyon syntrophicum]|jgi:DNA primase|uniref:DNA primase n=1 Tax=Candidatus Thiodictyon syntrophicum TaxID=1166950 RepID=A0A2K8UC24_9GAMM|nr:DNA primase [Candidatus Thiodictyon syntrophicum]AUB83144.1 DNA primase [Candidatus Thiodictyon syntrophicum]
MAGRIPPQFIDDLLARTDIVELIAGRIQLRKGGKDYQARCPFHDEKSPSFTVSREKQFYHCFGCGAHGTAIGFLMEYDRLGFREAIEDLARRAGLEVPTEGTATPTGPDQTPLYALLEQAAQVYRRQLREHPEAPQAIDYLKGRGLSGEIAARYGLGFAPSGWDFLLASLGADPAARERLSQAGLITEQDGKRYDRFRSRIMFPIRDRRGRVIGFGGRVLGDGKPKYLNSPETPVFHKGRELYGLYEVQQARRKLTRLLVVEGYLDVIALAQFGIDYAVATLGTATTLEHLQVLLRSAPELVFCFDGDNAGRGAAWKALETILPLATGNQSLRFLFLPEGEDPDTLVRAEGQAAFERRLGSATPLSEVFFDHLSGQVDMVSRDGRARLVTLAKPLISKVPDGIYRDMLEGRLAALAGIEPRRAARAGARRGGDRLLARPARPTRVALAIALLLDHPELAPVALAQEDDWRRCEGPGVEILAQLVDAVSAYPAINKATLIERWRDHPHFDYLQRLSVAPFLDDIPVEGLAAELTGALQGLGKDVRDSERLRPLNRRSTADWSDEVREQMDREAEQARTRRR